MHFDPRTQQALRETGLEAETIETVSARVAELVRDDADAIESFFSDRETTYSDLSVAHSSSDIIEHDVEYIDLYTHSADLRGYLKFDGWGVPVEDGRVLSDGLVELTLGGTVGERVRFAATRDRV